MTTPMRQLTTGCTCTERDTGNMFARWVAADCPKHSPALDHWKLHRSRPVERYGKAPACMCLYGVRRVEGAPGPYSIVNTTARYRRHEWGVWAFKIHPRCPHHGDGVRLGMTAMEWDAVVAAEQAAWSTLDDQERRGD